MNDLQLASTYVLEASDAEHARLIRGAQRGAAAVRELCARAGLGPGAHIVDVGCGPVGALVELAEIAGPRGRAVGIDSSAEAVATARALVSRKGLHSIRVVHGDIHTLDPAATLSNGPFDAAH